MSFTGVFKKLAARLPFAPLSSPVLQQVEFYEDMNSPDYMGPTAEYTLYTATYRNGAWRVQSRTWMSEAHSSIEPLTNFSSRSQAEGYIGERVKKDLAIGCKTIDWSGKLPFRHTPWAYKCVGSTQNLNTGTAPA